MIVPDLNLLLYAHNKGATRHSDAHLWWVTLLHGDEAIGIPWVVATGFIRLMSSPALISPPLSPRQPPISSATGSVTTTFRR